MSEIRIAAEGTDPAELADWIRATLEPGDSLTTVGGDLERGVPPDVLVAVINSGTQVVIALISGLLGRLRSRSNGRMVVYAANGVRFDLPADTSTERVRELLAESEAAGGIEHVQLFGRPAAT
jgi:hypothetical protein